MMILKELKLKILYIINDPNVSLYLIVNMRDKLSYRIVTCELLLFSYLIIFFIKMLRRNLI